MVAVNHQALYASAYELCSHQGVYLSSTGNLPAESQPDILRIADWGLDDDSEFQDKGLATEWGSEELERKLSDQLKVPPEVEAYYQDILSWDNEVQLAEDIVTRVQELEDELYIPDIAVDEYLDNLDQWVADIEFLGESECDPQEAVKWKNLGNLLQILQLGMRLLKNKKGRGSLSGITLRTILSRCRH